MDVVVLGGINCDFVVRGAELPSAGESLGGDVFLDSPGGKGGNTAVAAVRLGADVAIVGRVGRDERGRALIAALAQEGVDVHHVSIDPHTPTGATVIHVDKAGNKQVLAALGANLRLTPEDVRAAVATIQSARVLLVQLEVPLDCVVIAARLARAAGVRIVLDPAPPRTLPDGLIAMTYAVRANAEEAETLTGIRVRHRASAKEAAHVLISAGTKIAVVHAEGGNLLAWKSGEEWLPELPVTRVDATGAGDAFSAALSVALAEGQPLPAAGVFASAAAALATTVLGAQRGLPRRKPLERYVEEISGLVPTLRKSLGLD
jgi:ribokinase